jgi:membrane-bound lytic murein transglycosylase
VSNDTAIMLEPKDPAETTYYVFDFSALLAPDESIANYVLEQPAELVQVSDSSDGRAVTAYYSGGFEGKVYRPRCKITSDSATPQVLVRSLAFRCEKR